MNCIDINQCSIGDVCWAIISNSSKPIFGTVTQILKSENAIVIRSDISGYRTINCDHAFWDEKLAKKFKKKGMKI